MKIAALCVLSSLGLQVLGQVDSIDLQPWANLGSTAILGYLLIHLLLKTIPREREQQQQTLDTIHNRLHEDSERLNATLRDMAANCAESRAACESAKSEQRRSEARGK